MSKIDVVLVANDPDQGPVRELNNKTLGSGGRGIPFIEQIDVCFRSLFQNWKQEELPFKAYLLHTRPLGERMRKMLEPHVEQGLQVLMSECPVYHPEGAAYNRAAAFLDPRLTSPWRLSIDADLIFLQTPPLQFEASVQGMWAAYGSYAETLTQWAIANAAVQHHWNMDQYATYFGGWENLPHNLIHCRVPCVREMVYPGGVNMGCLQVKITAARELCQTFMSYVATIYSHKTCRAHGMRWMAPQIGMSLAIEKLSRAGRVEFSPLPPGVNYMPIYTSPEDTYEWCRDGISVYHYAQNHKAGLESDYYGHWFDPVPAYVTPEEMATPAGRTKPHG